MRKPIERDVTSGLGSTALRASHVIAGAVVVLAIVVGMGGASAGASGASSRSDAAKACRGRLLEKTTGGSLTEEIIPHGAGPETERVFLCSSAAGRVFEFPEGPLGNGYSFLFTGLTFAGDQAVALAFEWASVRAPELWVVDLATDKRIYKKALPSNVTNFETIEVGRIVLQRDGSVAWTELSPSGSCEVVEHTKGGTKVLDNTHKTEPSSLVLAGSTLSWREQDGEVRTATLR